MLKGEGCGMLAIFKKINVATVLRMDHGKKLGSGEGSLDMLVAVGQELPVAWVPNMGSV